MALGGLVPAVADAFIRGGKRILVSFADRDDLTSSSAYIDESENRVSSDHS
jgi:hypothetical protein